MSLPKKNNSTDQHSGIVVAWTYSAHGIDTCWRALILSPGLVLPASKKKAAQRRHGSPNTLSNIGPVWSDLGFTNGYSTHEND